MKNNKQPHRKTSRQKDHKSEPLFHTVSRTIQRLQRAGLVTALPYRSIFLTEGGRKLAEESRRRHETVVEFLKSLGVPGAVASSDAEGIEHHVSKETLAAFVKHLEKIS